MWSSKSSGEAKGLIPFRSLGALALTLICPLFVLFLVRWGAPDEKVSLAHGLQFSGHNGNLHKALSAVLNDPRGELDKFFFPAGKPEVDSAKYVEAAKALGAFMAFAIFLLKAIPGPIHYGPVSASGHVPEYVKNGPAAYATAILTFVLGAYNGWWDGAIVMRLYPWMIVLLNGFALALCALLVVKGHLAPSTKDASSSGNPVMDFYWGTELYPRLFGVDVKTFTNCRFGMVAWATALISFAWFNAEINGGEPTLEMLVSAFLIVFYLGKFFIWEHGYFNTMDIAHDRAGFYICWGCLVWVQTVYVSQGYFFAYQTDSFLKDKPWLAIAIAVIGVVCVYLNYEADRQRMHARATKGRGSAWGKPYHCVEAYYETEDGTKRKSLLLASHLWKPARHFHYVFEILAAVAWCVPVTDSIFPNFYWIFLTLLLFDRASRDDARCSAKYGKYWDEYKAIVPYLVIPGLW
jgi:7-dehydrocholesterol reductase